MPETPLRFAKAGPHISVADLARYGQDWLLDGEIRQLSRCTLDTRRFLVAKLLWFFREREFSACGESELRAFLHYLSGRNAQPTITTPGGDSLPRPARGRDAAWPTGDGTIRRLTRSRPLLATVTARHLTGDAFSYLRAPNLRLSRSRA